MPLTSKLIIDGKQIELPVVEGTEQEIAIDIGKLRAQTGIITLDNGFGNTGAVKSALTYLDGDKGIHRYRGYDIEDLCAQASFFEVSYLLIFGNLPNKKELDDYSKNITLHTMINEDIKHYYDVWPNSAHPLALLSSVVSGLSTFYEDSFDIFDKREVEISIHRLLAKIPTIAAFAHKKSKGQPMVYPNNKLSYAGNFLNMMFSVPSEEYEIDPVIERALEQLLILHMDHEQNCSTSTVRIVGSSQANLFASVAAGVLALSGPLHGGANQGVIEMLEHIQREGGNVDKFIDRAKDKKDKFRLMGFGHRVYKNFDPKAKIIKKICDQVLNKLGIEDPLLEIAKKLEEKALSDSYFVDRKLYPNMDFYSGIIYKAMGFPTKIFTVLFAIGRLTGWIAHWKEMIESPETKIGRPRQVYVGSNTRVYKSMANR